MCGIAGAYAFAGDGLRRETVKRMGDLLAHRGPDDHRYYFWSPSGGNELYRHGIPASETRPTLGFAHRRLSIIDIKSGHQPMTNEDDSRWICFNGEIYNYLELRQALIASGHIFRTHSDTEVLLHLYEECGVAGLARLNGMFAFALWDARRRELLLARDRFGIKPLYYTITRDKFLFGSEIKALFAFDAVPRQPDYAAIAEHFTFQNQFGSRTFFAGVRLLEPGTWLICRENGEIITRRYWQLNYPEPDNRPVEVLADELREHFVRGVQRQLMSEVPLGSYLSGGMDTGSITAVTARSLPQMHTFTCGFDIPEGADELEQYFDESADSFHLAALLNTQHHEVRLSHTHNFAVLPQVAWALDEPRLGISYQNWYTARLIRQYVVVVLGGGGGDELFAGYPWRHSAILNDTTLAQWDMAYYRQWIRFMDDEQKHEFFSDEVNHAIAGFSTFDSFRQVMNGLNTTDPLHRALAFDMQTFLHGLLVVEDKLSMAHSIEARVPFLDNDFVDFTLRIPSHYKLKGDEGKLILRRAMQPLLPPETISRRKQGFTPPDATWYRREMRPQVEALLLSDRALSRGYFKPEAVRRIVDEHLTEKRNHRFLLWSLLVFEWWNRLFIDDFAPPEQ